MFMIIFPATLSYISFLTLRGTKVVHWPATLHSIHTLIAASTGFLLCQVKPAGATWDGNIRRYSMVGIFTCLCFSELSEELLLLTGRGFTTSLPSLCYGWKEHCHHKQGEKDDEPHSKNNQVISKYYQNIIRTLIVGVFMRGGSPTPLTISTHNSPFMSSNPQPQVCGWVFNTYITIIII